MAKRDVEVNCVKDWLTFFHFLSYQGIHQNGGFTKVWFAMKTFLTPSILIIMVWYWRRITLMTRPPVLLEK